MNTYKKYIKYILLGIIAVTIAALLPKKNNSPQYHPRDYAEIEKSKILRAVTEYNSLSYFVEGDTVSGFHYDLIQAFAQDKNLKLEITPEMSFSSRMIGLEEGKYDIIAYSLLATSELKDSINLTSPIILNKQVLVQRKRTKEDSLYIQNQLDLAGKTLHVVKGSPSILRIHNLGDEIGDTIYIKEVEKYGSEQLLAMVSHGDIDYAVCDESIARSSIDSLANLDINTDISFTQFYSWGINKKSPALLDSLNSWLNSFIKTKKYQEIYSKYY